MKATAGGSENDPVSTSTPTPLGITPSKAPSWPDQPAGSKANIMVAVRVRPLLPLEPQDSVCLFKVKNQPQLVLGKERSFTFDHVFDTRSQQEELSSDCVRPLIDSLFLGYNATIFAYGQTGSGKTYTMGSAAPGASETRGIIPRAISEIFERVSRLRATHRFQLRVSFLEIYNEEIRDLLPAEGGATPKGKGKAADNKLKISDANGVVVVPGLRAAKVEDAEGLASLLQGAVKVRATAATKCNEHSSRSHYVFRMAIKGRNGTTNESIDGELNLIDLAGSERTKESGVTGAAMTEANAINKSLSSLGDVISAMGSRSKGSHIPYRNSKLTHMLQNALSGSAKTLMFVNVNPTAHQESLSSLRFAAKVGGVEVGPAAQAKKKGD